MATIRVDISGLEELEREIEQLAVQATGRLGERAYMLMREEVPVETGNLRQGVVGYPPGGEIVRDKDAPPVSRAGRPVSKPNRAQIVVSARRARRGPRRATLHLASGKTREIRLRSVKSYNYAERVAKGRDAIKPKRGEALLIPVDRKPDKGSYITDGDQIYVVRKSAEAVKADPYHKRAAKRLRSEAPVIVEKVVEKLFDG